MSHLYSKIASGKRNQESVGFPQSSHFMNGTPSRKIDIFLLRLAKMHSLQQTYNRVSKPPILNPTLSVFGRAFAEETLNNGPASPPHNISFNNSPAGPQHHPQQQLLQQQRENMQITQPCSPSSSPLASPNALSLGGHFQLPSSSSSSSSNPAKSVSSLATGVSGHSSHAIGLALVTAANATDTADPNWQANKGSVRERNAAMFNNDLMADIKFVVGADGE